MHFIIRRAFTLIHRIITLAAHWLCAIAIKILSHFSLPTFTSVLLGNRCCRSESVLLGRFSLCTFDWSQINAFYKDRAPSFIFVDSFFYFFFMHCGIFSLGRVDCTVVLVLVPIIVGSYV